MKEKIHKFEHYIGDNTGITIYYRFDKGYPGTYDPDSTWPLFQPFDVEDDIEIYKVITDEGKDITSDKVIEHLMGQDGLVSDMIEYGKEYESHVESTISEKAKSKKQQKFMGMVHQCKKTGKCASKEVAKTAKSMKGKDVEDFASTKHKGLPEKKRKKSKKVKENTMNKQKKLMTEFINNICNKDYSAAKANLSGIVDEKMKKKIKEIAENK